MLGSIKVHGFGGAGDTAHQPTSHIQPPGPTCLGAKGI